MTIIEGNIERKPGREIPRTPLMKQVMKDIGIRMNRELNRNILEKNGGKHQ